MAENEDYGFSVPEKKMGLNQAEWSLGRYGVGITVMSAGPGSAPSRATTLPSDPAARKAHPVASGVLDYFPDAIAAISHVSWTGNEQHNPGQPLHWDRSKSKDEADTMMRHFLERGTLDKDGMRHTAKMAWRALAILQKEIEAEQTAATPKT
jgi:hypothetical protein